MRSLRSTSVIVALLWASVCQAVAAAEVKVTGPTDPVSPGLPVFLNTDGVKKGDPYQLFIVPDDGQFLVLFDTTDQPVGIYSQTKVGSYVAVLVAYDAESKQIAKSMHTIRIGGPAPPIPPTPIPPVPPEPIPDGKLGFTKLAYTEATKLTDKSKTLAIADNFEGTAAAIAAGTIKTVDAANTDMVTKNRAVLSDPERTVWLPFFRAWSDAADAALRAGTLRPIAAEYAEIYRATADGLRRVK